MNSRPASTPKAGSSSWGIIRGGFCGHGDFGPSLSYEGWSVNDIMAQRAAGVDGAGIAGDLDRADLSAAPRA